MHGILGGMKRYGNHFLFKEQNTVAKGILSFLLLAGSAAAFIVCILCGMGNDLWYDEVFSMGFIQNGYAQIAALTAADVHPPFYYWYLKAFCDVGALLLPQASGIVLAKMASVLPFIGIWVYAWTLIRKRMGIHVMSLFLFLVFAMPQISNYTVEIRMYALAFFLITAVFLHGYEIIWEDRLVHWILFCILGILTAYTQYYACVCVVAVYLALFVFFACRKRKKQMIRLFVCAGLSVLSYLPWIPSFVRQVRTVSSSYWIQPLTLKSIFGCIKYVFLPVSYDTVKNYVLAVCMILIFAGCFFHALKKEKDARVRCLLLCGVWIPVFTALTGFVCSICNRPVFVYRYLIPGLGAFWLVAACAIRKYHKKWIALLLLVPFVLGGYSNMQGFYGEEHKKLTQMESTEELLDAFPKDAVIVCNFDHVQALTGYYLSNDNYLYGGSTLDLIARMQPQCMGMPDTEDIYALTDEQDVYFFGSFHSREELLKEWEDNGISHTEEGTYLLERYYFNVYHLKKEK